MFDTPFPPDFQQGGYNILLQAEKEIEEKKIESAIENFKIAFMRAFRCGRKGVAIRIKTRLATAGFELAETDPESASLFLRAYSLFSEDFEKTATLTESFILNKSRGKISSFRYPLVYKNGSRTFWLDAPQCAPIFIYRMLDPQTELYKYPGFLIYLKAKDLPKNYNFSYVYPFSISCPKGTRAFEIEFNSKKEELLAVVVGTNDREKYYFNIENPISLKKEVKEFEIPFQKSYFVLNSIIVFSNTLSKKEVDIFLVRNYSSL